MTIEEKLEKLKNYLEDEYRSVVNILTRDNPLFNPNNIKNLSLQRGLGACQFIQYLGVPFEEVDEVYATFKEAVEAIVPTKEREVRG